MAFSSIIAARSLSRLFLPVLGYFSSFSKKPPSERMKGLPRPIQKPHPPILMGCAGKRMLSLAAREANGISLMFRISPQDRDGTNALLEEQLVWLREAAGSRFAHLELTQLAYKG